MTWPELPWLKTGDAGSAIQLCDRLLGSFEDGVGRNAFGYLINDVRAYQATISGPLRDIQFTDVWRRGLGLQTIAEYVENEETIDVLRRTGVDYVQGFYLGKPRPLVDIIGRLADSAGAALA